MEQSKIALVVTVCSTRGIDGKYRFRYTNTSGYSKPLYYFLYMKHLRKGYLFEETLLEGFGQYPETFTFTVNSKTNNATYAYAPFKIVQFESENIITVPIEKEDSLKEYLSGFLPPSIDRKKLIEKFQKDEIAERELEENSRNYKNLPAKRVEGKPKLVFTTIYERNPDIKADAVQIHGINCMVCGFNFLKMYGDIGRDYIEAHHIKPLSSLPGETEIDVKKDIVVLCSNCHKMIHRRRSVLKMEELKKLVDDQKKKSPRGNS